MKTALNTREPRIICPTLKILQQMILLSPMVGQALVPYYRQVHAMPWPRKYLLTVTLPYRENNPSAVYRDNEERCCCCRGTARTVHGTSARGLCSLPSCLPCDPVLPFSCAIGVTHRHICPTAPSGVQPVPGEEQQHGRCYRLQPALTDKHRGAHHGDAGGTRVVVEHDGYNTAVSRLW